MSFVQGLKRRLARVRPTSWHYKIVGFVWEKRRPRKACSYYWFYLPSALVGAGLILLATGIAAVIGAFAGYFPKKQTLKGEWPFGEYKRLPSGRKLLVAPWHIAAVAGAVVLSWWLITVAPGVGFWVGIGLGLFVVVGASALLLWQNRNTPRMRELRLGVRSWWDKACPPLEIRNNGSDQKREASVGSGGSGRA